MPQSSSGGSGIVREAYNVVVPSYPNDYTEVFVHKAGGISGTTVATVTIIYTDSSKKYLSSIVKT